MNDDFPTETTIRRYLLGGLDDQGDLRDRLSEQMFLNADLSEVVDSIEDEIIEEYLDRRVSADDKKRIEEYFLRPPERQEKLKFVRYLRDHFKTSGEVLAKKKLNVGLEATPVVGVVPGTRPVLYWRSHSRTYYELAACILLVALSLFYVSRINHRWQDQLDSTLNNKKQLESELAEERERSVNLAKQLEQARPTVATLTFFGPSFRDKTHTPVVVITPWTRRIKVEIGLSGTSSGNYDVRLEGRGRTTIWFRPNLTASSGGLRFEIPVAEISSGTYCLVVRSRPEPYCFQAKISRN